MLSLSHWFLEPLPVTPQRASRLSREAAAASSSLQPRNPTSVTIANNETEYVTTSPRVYAGEQQAEVVQELTFFRDQVFQADAATKRTRPA